MKVLYISEGAVHEYMNDMLFHGLHRLLGSDVVDVNHMEFMFQGTIHGGYTLWGLLPNLEVDRTDILSKIRNRYFDLVIYGMVHLWREFLNEVETAYPPSRIFFIDGCDDYSIAPVQKGSGLYFKREIPDAPEYADMFPIQFCVPREKIVSSIPDKIRLMAPLDPSDRSTYGYVTEESYREMYAVSRFGKTIRKGGWDCLRHCEIMMMGCLPYFLGLEACPARTLEYLPKVELLLARQIYDTWPAMESRWEQVMLIMMNLLRKNLTTEAVAKRVLERVR